MNLPNKLTLLRVLMIPLFLVFFYAESIPFNYLWAFITFLLASLTDMFDGIIARKRGLITDFGKLMDPLADKLLTITAFVVILSNLGLYTHLAGGRSFEIICLIIIISREFIVTSIRLIAAEKGIVIAADKWGKLKTIFQMIWVCQVLLLYEFAFLSFSYSFPTWLEALILPLWIVISPILFFVMMLLTVGSGINYCVKNRHLFKDM